MSQSLRESESYCITEDVATLQIVSSYNTQYTNTQYTNTIMQYTIHLLHNLRSLGLLQIILRMVGRSPGSILDEEEC